MLRGWEGSEVLPEHDPVQEGRAADSAGESVLVSNRPSIETVPTIGSNRSSGSETYSKFSLDWNR